MLTKTSMLACILAAGTTTAQADIFTWLANSGMWEDPGMWNGPPGQYPNSILDTATISGSETYATLGQNLAIGTLNVLNGATVYSVGHSMFINADTEISGPGSSISVTSTPSLRDFDTDTLTIDDNGILAMYGGLAQFDEALIIEHGAVLGAGTIEMNSTTGNLVLNQGALWITSGVFPYESLLVTRSDSSTSKLDWTSPDASLIAWDQKTLINELPYTGPLGGRISISSYGGDTAIESTHGFIAAASSEISFSGNNPDETGHLNVPFLDSYGHFSVGGAAFLETSLLAMRGDMLMQGGAIFRTNADLVNFHAFEINTEGDNAIVQFNMGSDGIMNFKDGVTSIIMGHGSRFDLDGNLYATVNIEDDAIVWIEAEYLDYGTQSPFNGTLNIDGDLHLEPVNGAITLTNDGVINLNSGELTGRGIVNNGIIRGTGTIQGASSNNGEIIADGGTLEFGFVNMDGTGEFETGILRAESGDLVMNMQADGGTRFFTGSLYVGNGVGIREVFNADVDLILRDVDGVRGSITLNSGFVSIDDFLSYGDMTVDGTSLFRTTGTNDADRISFSSGSVTTVNGTLEVDGRTWFVPGAQVLGSGIIDSVSTTKGFFLQDQADLGGVSLISSGPVYLYDFFDSQVSVNAFTMRDTASLNVSMWYSQQEAQILSDKLSVQEHTVLDGELVLDNYPVTDLPTGETVTILEASSIEGEFDAIDFSGLGANRRAYVTVSDTRVEVFVTCFADLNADGQSDFFDASSFMSLFQAEDPMADLNQDGEFNFFDVSVFLSAYDMGC
jgi:hypothetical protein